MQHMEKKGMNTETLELSQLLKDDEPEKQTGRPVVTKFRLRKG